MIVLSFIMNILQTNGISMVTANIIDALKTMDKSGATTYFNYFIIITIMYLCFYYAYGYFQNITLTKIRQWIKLKLVDMLFTVNNHNFSEMNFIKINSPINRISSTCFMIINDAIQIALPILVFLIVVTFYFLYKDWKLGLAFAIGHAILIYYIVFSWSDMKYNNEIHEDHINKNESHLLELLNNVDKIVTRGQVENEVKIFSDKTENGINKAMNYYSNVNMHTTIMTTISYVILFLSIGYLLWSFFKKEIDFKSFVALFSILILYRDKMSEAILQIPQFIDFIGRADATLKHFSTTASDYDEISKLNRVPMSLNFDTIQFENINFKYKTADSYIYQNANFLINIDNKIIGITGPSGRGKSTFAKLLIKLYQPESGKIYIDNQDIENIDVDYLRKNITYINQTSKLFDKKIIDNILYGCPNEIECRSRMDIVLKYNKIRELFDNIDIYTTKAGSLGEGVSGGQRQVINIISGLIHPSKILILDEPTNALDGELKTELLALIKEFKQYKKCILIITHDKEVESILTDTMTV